MKPPAYQAIADRPPLTLPDDAQVAVWVVMNVEHFPFGQIGTAIQPHLTSPPEIANYGWRDYGNRVGIWRLFDLFDELEIPVTAALNADICTHYPQIVAGMQQRQWEVMAHGLNNCTGHSGLDLAAESALIQQTLDTIAQATGDRPQGWLTPGFSITENTFDLLHQAGISYTADWVNDDQPYWYPLPKGKLLAIPYTLEANDITLCLSARMGGPAFARSVIDQFEQLWQDGSKHPRVMAIGLHPFIVGQPLRVTHLKQCLQHIKNHPRTWLTTGSGLYDWMINTGLGG